MSDQPTPAQTDAINSLARSLYITLVAEAVQFKEQGASIAASPDNLVQLSYKLAEAFNKVEDQRAQAARPKATSLDLGKIDFGV